MEKQFEQMKSEFLESTEKMKSVDFSIFTSKERLELKTDIQGMINELESLIESVQQPTA